ncbi:sterol desaturase family protein [Vibrio tapetis subsp. quintayensis]|uniref:sterol desaturase family protein n=1 Tax=Vibrio tapetis TaxID=52443 RepID=UPI0025B54A28|nr:sterol desaturase family protein [Vibrio tapetis]MDN3679139.1 sterol desaturase family protein [Vibrio tapetis subsp. quintayensis]
MDNQTSIRLAFFLSVLVLCALWEFATPRKALTQSKWVRWSNNLGLVGLNSLILAIIMPLMAIDVALLAQQHGLGLFNLTSLPLWLNIILSVVLLDATIYFQHRLFHTTPWLWRLHRMHHADQDIDVTTGARFHPIEILLSMAIKMAAVVVFGVSPIAVLIFEVVLNASAMFNHSNAKLNLPIDKWLRRVIVTPDMHRVHHSVIVKETNSNYGFFLSIWDRMFGSYCGQPELGHNKVVIGLPYFRKPQEQHIWHMLLQPFKAFRPNDKR